MWVEDKSRPNAFGHFEAFYNCGLQEAAAVDAARTVGMPPKRGDGGEFDGPSWALYRYWLSQDPAFRYAPSGMPIGSVFQWHWNENEIDCVRLLQETTCASTWRDCSSGRKSSRLLRSRKGISRTWTLATGHGGSRLMCTSKSQSKWDRSPLNRC